MNENDKDLARANRLNEAYRHLFAYFGISSQTDFAKAIHVQRSALSAAMNGSKLYLTNNFFTKICAAFPGVFNLDYFLKGEGELLLAHEEQPSGTLDQSSLINAALAAKDETIRSKDELIASLRETIDSLRQQISMMRNHQAGDIFTFPIGVAEEPTNLKSNQ